MTYHSSFLVSEVDWFLPFDLLARGGSVLADLWAGFYYYYFYFILFYSGNYILLLSNSHISRWFLAFDLQARGGFEPFSHFGRVSTVHLLLEAGRLGQ